MLVLSLFNLVLVACANIVPPTGGDKDISPPKVLEARPASESLNFNSEEIVLVFDEYVSIKNPQALVVSPHMENPPELSLKGKKLYIKFEEALKDSTTYTLSFGNSIVDINEGNPATDLFYAFSTGPTIDSLRLEGECLESFSLDPVEGVSVGLFPIGESPKSSKPIYRTISSKDGSFQFRNLSNKPFELYAFKDLDNNLLLSQNESRAFLAEPVQASIDSFVNLRIFDEPKSKLINKVSSNKQGLICISFNHPADELALTFKGAEILNQWSLRADSLCFDYLALADSFSLHAQKFDLVDSISLLIPEIDSAFRKDFTIRKTLFKVELNSNISVPFSQSIHKIDEHSIRYFKDSKLMSDSLSITAEGPKLIIDLPLNSLSSYSIVFADSSFLSYQGTYSKADTLYFKTPNFKEYGSLKFSGADSIQINSILIELLDDAGLSYGFLHKREGSFWPYLKEGSYSLRVIKDENRNGRYDAGIFNLKQFPEEVINLESFVLVKANSENIVSFQRILSSIE